MLFPATKVHFCDFQCIPLDLDLQNRFAERWSRHGADSLVPGHLPEICFLLRVTQLPHHQQEPMSITLILKEGALINL